jgi:hypothetical protein
MPLDLDRVAFVTRAYPRMRRAIANVMLGPVLIWLLRSVRLHDVGATVLGFVCFVPVLTALHYLDRWLDRRFGRVDNGQSARRSGWRAGLAAGLFNSGMKFDDWVVRSGGPSVLLLALAGVGLWATIRDWPHRAYTSIFFAVCLVSALTLPSLAHQADFLEWRIRADTAAILAWMVVGVCDFLVLRQVMRRPLAVEGKNDA